MSNFTTMIASRKLELIWANFARKVVMLNPTPQDESWQTRYHRQAHKEMIRLGWNLDDSLIWINSQGAKIVEQARNARG